MSLFIRPATARVLAGILTSPAPSVTADYVGRKLLYSAYGPYNSGQVAAGVLAQLAHRGLVAIDKSQRGSRQYCLTELGVYSLFNYEQEYGSQYTFRR